MQALQLTINEANAKILVGKEDLKLARSTYRQMVKEAKETLPEEYETNKIRLSELKKQIATLKEASEELRLIQEQIELDNDALREADNFLVEQVEKFEKIKSEQIKKVAVAVGNSGLVAEVKIGQQLSLNF